MPFSLLPVAWRPLAALSRPAPAHVLVLRAHVPACEALATGLAPNLLPPDELTRAARYHHPADRQRFLVARVALRALLGRWLALAPAAVRLGVGAHKKPFLENDSTLHFSLAHTREWVLLALADASLGVDIEGIDPKFPFADILSAAFSAAEQAAIAQAPDPQRYFYQLWTRKEALAKATGRGLDDTLPTLPVLADAPLGSPWRLTSFAVAADQLAALAYPVAKEWEVGFEEITPAALQGLLVL